MADRVEFVSRGISETRLNHAFGVEVTSRARELGQQLRDRLGKIPRADAARAILTLDELLTEAYELRTVFPHASDCPR